MKYLLIFVVIFFNSAASLFLKKASIDELTPNAIHILGISYNIYTFLGIFFYAIAFVAYYCSMKFFKLSYVQPVTTAGVILFVVISSIMIFSERISGINIVGIFFIILGVVMATVS